MNDEDEYNDALDAFDRFADYAERMNKEDINPFTGEKYDD